MQQCLYRFVLLTTVHAVHHAGTQLANHSVKAAAGDVTYTKQMHKALKRDSDWEEC